MPNATVTASTLPSRTGSRIASPRTSAIRRSSPAARTLLQPERQHRAGEVDADHARGAAGPPRRASSATSAVPVQTSSSVSRPVSRSDANRPRAPAAVDAGAEEVVEQVVARRDRIEHPGDAIGRLVGRDVASRLNHETRR